MHGEDVGRVVIDRREIQHPTAFGGGGHGAYRQVPAIRPAPGGDDSVLGCDEGDLAAQTLADFGGHIDVEALQLVIRAEKRLRRPVGGGRHLDHLGVVDAVQGRAGPGGTCGGGKRCSDGGGGEEAGK
ncbi:hypothetical protein D3C73_1114730 [compost metagenome]